MHRHPRRRKNLAESVVEEVFKPPLFTGVTTRRERALAMLRRFLDLQASSIWRDLQPELATVRGTLLDVGCGAQPYRPLLAPTVRYLGIDTAAARADFGYHVPDTILYSGDEWPVPAGSIDAVLCTETMEHVLDPLALLGQAFRALRPGGRLVLTVPFAARWHFIPHDYWRFTPSALKHLLHRAGFSAVVIEARGNRLTVACLKNMALLLPLLLPGKGASMGARIAQLISALGLPLLGVWALIGNLSLLAEGGDDCLGYTVFAERPAAPGPAIATEGSPR